MFLSEIRISGERKTERDNPASATRRENRNDVSFGAAAESTWKNPVANRKSKIHLNFNRNLKTHVARCERMLQRDVNSHSWKKVHGTSFFGAFHPRWAERAADRVPR